MRLGLNLGYWSSGDSRDGLALARLADDLGYDSCWVAEAYGSDAASVLGYLAANTRRIGLGSAVFQIPARSAAMTAMTAATLDVLSDGRFRLGLGVSGPQVSEGWHGVRFDSPLQRTREYVAVTRLTLSRKPVSYNGSHLVLPLPDGPGKTLRLTIKPVQDALPIYLAAVGPRNLRLCGEIADGWLGLFFSAEQAAVSLDPIRAGRAGRCEPGTDPMAGFDVCISLPAAVHECVEQAVDAVRGYYALYIGGMGSRERNFYHHTATRLGFGPQADTIQDLYLAGRQREAAAAVPADLVEATALVGPPHRIARQLSAFAEVGVTTVSVFPFGADLAERQRVLSVVAQAARDSGVTDDPGKVH